jgi:transposase
VAGPAGPVRAVAHGVKRHNRWSADGTYDRLIAAAQARADAAGDLDWLVAVDWHDRAGASARREGPGGLGRITGSRGLTNRPITRWAAPWRVDDQDPRRGRRSCRSLAIHLTAGQVHDTTQFATVLAGIRVPRRVRAGRAPARGGSWQTRRTAAGPTGCCYDAARSPTRSGERGDQQANRTRRGRRGGRPCSFDRDSYRRRITIERNWNKLKQWRGIATRYDKTATNSRGGSSLPSCSPGPQSDSRDTA